MTTATVQIRAVLNSAFSDRSPEWQDASTFDGLPITTEAARHWSHKLGRIVNHYTLNSLSMWNDAGACVFCCPRWLITERSKYARTIRRELQRGKGETFRRFFREHGATYRSRHDTETKGAERIFRLIRTCGLSPNETISRQIYTIPDGLASQIDTRSFTYRPFAFNNCVGLEFETYGAIRRDALADALPHWTRVVSDGSIRPTNSEADGHEIRVLLDRTTAEPRLFRLCAKMQQLGLRVNRSCGLHIHLDARSVQSFDELLRTGRIMDAWLYALRELLPASRRGNDYCKFGIAPTDRYRAVNVSSWGKHRTLEIRCHSATLDYTKVVAWLRLCELIRAMPKKPKLGASCIATLEQLPLPAHDLAYWRARHRELNPALYSNNATDTTTDSE